MRLTRDLLATYFLPNTGTPRCPSGRLVTSGTVRVPVWVHRAPGASGEKKQSSSNSVTIESWRTFPTWVLFAMSRSHRHPCDVWHRATPLTLDEVSEEGGENVSEAVTAR